MANRKYYREEDQSFRAYFDSPSSSACIYSVIGYKERIRLIQMVYVEKKQIIQAAATLGIKTSTAKHILKRFRKQGKILRKNSDKSEEYYEYQSKVQELKAKIDKVNPKMFECRLKKLRSKQKDEEISKINSGKQQIVLQQTFDIRPNHEKQRNNLQVVESQQKQPSEQRQPNQQFYYCYVYGPIWTDYSSIMSNFIQN